MRFFSTSSKSSVMVRRSGYCVLLLQVFMMIASLDIVSCSEAQQSVGKLRASAELASSKGEFENALNLWAQVIQAEPANDSNYYKRFRIFLRQQKYKEALADLNSAVNLNKQSNKYNEQTLVQRGKLLMRMGKCPEAEQDFKLLKSVAPNNKDVVFGETAAQCTQALQQAEQHYARSNWQVARDMYATALQHAEHAAGVYLRKAWCEFHLGDMYESIADTGKALKIESDNIEALELRGGNYYTLGEFESAMNHYRMGLKYDPEHAGCKGGHRLVKKITQSQSKAQQAMEKQEYENALKHLQTLIDTDPQHSVTVPKARVDLASAYKGMGKFKEAKGEAEKAIQLNDNDAEAHRVLASIHTELEEFDEAVFQLKRANELRQDDRGLQDELRRAEAAQKQSKQKDYYKILGVSRKATKKEIKRVYRELALQWHPDKHVGEEEKEKANAKFQLISEAYEVLEDDEKRSKYDRGEEVFPNQGGGQQQGHNPFAHFGHGGPFGGFGGGGHQFHFNFG